MFQIEECEYEWTQTQRDVLDEVNGSKYVLTDIIAEGGLEAYRAHLEQVYDYIKAGFEHKEFREFPTKFKFREEDERVYVLQLRHYLTNLMFWLPFVKLDLIDEMDETFIVDCSKISTKYIKWYIDTKLIIPFGREFGSKKLNKAIADMIFELTRPATDFGLILGLSLNLETIMDVAERFPRFNEIIHTKLDPDMQPQELEELLNNMEKEEVEILMNDPIGNFLQPMLKAGSGIKTTQLRELTGAGGLKPDLFGNTMPVPITGNFIYGGLGSVANYYVDSAAARKAVVMNKTVMGKSGYFARKVMLIATDILLRKDEKECNTVNTIQYEIKTKDHLRRLRGRNVSISPSITYMLKGDEDYLIGKTLHVYSPVTCASEEGVCKKCYGNLYYTNRELFSIGAYAAAKTTNPISQNVLSTKHLLTTISKRIDFNDTFYKFFNLITNEVIINSQNEEIDINEYYIYINPDEIESLEEFDEKDYSRFIYKFYVKKKKETEYQEIYELDGKEIYISPSLDSVIRSSRKNSDGMIEIPIKSLNDEEKIFSIIVSNSELTDSLYKIMALLDRKGNLGCTSISEICQKLVDLFIDSHINLDAVHAELLVRPLIRRTDNILKFPKFNTYRSEKDYQIIPVTTALENNPSVLISLSFQALGRQFSKPLTYQKNSVSFIDAFFREEL